MPDDSFIEVECHQASKHAQPVSGDVFFSRKGKDDHRIVSVLSDGLGSGIKASVLATLTSSMAAKFVTSDIGITKAARIMMDILPICSERKIGYSTFTIVDIDAAGHTLIIEHDNPSYLVLRGAEHLETPKTTVDLGVDAASGHERLLLFSRFRAQAGDRILFFSDGVNQSGMGRRQMPLGWGLEAVRDFALGLVRAEPQISARDLARRIVEQAVANDEHRPKDDITCGVIYFRRPRRLLVVSGPPFTKESDVLLAAAVAEFDGKIAICGGTTADIIGRELHRSVHVNLDDDDPFIPPTAIMAGIDLVTEGTITLARVAELLDQGIEPEHERPNAATRLVELLLNSDLIHFLIGTRINEAHQDPNVPVELDIRRNIVRKIRALLEDKCLKETQLRFF